MSRTDTPARLTSAQTVAGDYVVLLLAGRLDSMTAPQAEEELAGAVAVGLPLVVVDLDAADFVSSPGLHALLVAARQADRHGGRLTLVCSRRDVLDVLDMTGVGNLLGVHPSVGRALAAYRHLL